MTRPRRPHLTPEEQEIADQIAATPSTDDVPEVPGPHPRTSGLLGGREHARLHQDEPADDEGAPASE
jgi:hypothetical protein